MDRRNFIRSAATLAATSCTGGLAGCALTSSDTGMSTQLRSFALSSIAEDPGSALRLHGHWPADLQGTLFRNGPALFSRNGDSQDHLFDGDGMVHAYRIHAGEIRHHSRYVQTEKFIQEQQANRFLYSGSASVRAGSLPLRTNDTINMANTSLRKVGNKYFALWEGGSAYEIDPGTLATRSRHTLAPELEHAPFSAHPVQDTNGDTWNFGSLVNIGQAKTLLYQLGPNGKLKRTKLIDMDFAGYMHAFAISQNYIILLNTCCIHQAAETFIGGYTFHQDKASQFIFIDKNDLEVKYTIEVPANFVFHFGNAFEEKGTLFLSTSEYSNADIMLKGMALNTHHGLGAGYSTGKLVQYEFKLATGQYKKKSTAVDIEFPQYDLADPYHAQTLFGAGESGKKKDNIANALVAINPITQRDQTFSYAPGIIAEEPLLVRSKRHKHYIMQTFIDLTHRNGGIALFEPTRLAEGPIALATTKVPIPLGFHGCFVAS
ncbi:Carotenoid cleavage dioxygenase [Alteromonadaceae bacterium Bs31]|nr:Carotenoid cleavage dioxygenase [Alteromonadaceae bacterium Bs31]